MMDISKVYKNIYGNVLHNMIHQMEMLKFYLNMLNHKYVEYVIRIEINFGHIQL
jgi:hypothetical protein